LGQLDVGDLMEGGKREVEFGEKEGQLRGILGGTQLQREQTLTFGEIVGFDDVGDKLFGTGDFGSSSVERGKVR
jgi:hypothetical protein